MTDAKASRIYLTDDGTMDTVLRCQDCGEELRYNWQPTDPDDDEPETYDDFVSWAIQDAESEHDCLAEDN